MRTVRTASFVLPRFDLPIKGKQELDLRQFSSFDRVQRMHADLSDVPGFNAAQVLAAQDANAQVIARDADFETKSQFGLIVESLKEAYTESMVAELASVDENSVLNEDAARVHVKRLAKRSNAVLNEIKQRYQHQANLKRVLLRANKVAFLDLVNLPRFLANANSHDALAKFESMSGMTPQSGFFTANSEPAEELFVPAHVEELDWQDEGLKFLAETFDMKPDDLEAIVKKITFYNEQNAKLDGYAVYPYGKFYLNTSATFLNGAIDPKLEDPDQKRFPEATLAHELVHVILKEKYPEFFSPFREPNAEIDSARFSIEIEGREVPLHWSQMEELFCYAMTIYVNPITSLAKLNSLSVDNDGNDISILLGKDLYRGYGLSERSRRVDPRVSTAIREQVLALAKAYLAQVEQAKEFYLPQTV